MDIEKFKKESKETYVYVTGDFRGLVVYRKNNTLPFETNTIFRKYSGYILVPFCFADFTSFNERQQKAICEAEIVRSGLCIEVESCDPNVFYYTEDEIELRKTISSLRSFATSEHYNIVDLGKTIDRAIELIEANNQFAVAFLDLLEQIVQDENKSQGFIQDVIKITAKLKDVFEDKDRPNWNRLKKFCIDQYNFDIETNDHIEKD